jgi:hypothetical protein
MKWADGCVMGAFLCAVRGCPNLSKRGGSTNEFGTVVLQLHWTAASGCPAPRLRRHVNGLWSVHGGVQPRRFPSRSEAALLLENTCLIRSHLGHSARANGIASRLEFGPRCSD